jgi:hypothetical protein
MTTASAPLVSRLTYRPDEVRFGVFGIGTRKYSTVTGAAIIPPFIIP